MLLNFEFENYACFRDRTEFTMLATALRQRRETLACFGEPARGTCVLPSAAIYGGNAAGKSQFVRALSFVRHLALGDYKAGSLLPAHPFLFGEAPARAPGRFAIQLLARDTVYELAFSVTGERIESERLSKYNTRGDRKITLYSREGDSVSFDDPSFGDGNFRAFAEKAAEPTRLFLTTAVQLKVEAAMPVFNWFRDTLHIVFPDAQFLNTEEFTGDGPIGRDVRRFLHDYDTGIDGLETQAVNPESIIPVKMLEQIRADLKPGETARVMADREVALLSIGKDGALVARRIIADHRAKSGRRERLPMLYESDGTRRMLDLVPAICMMERAPAVFVIDELDRSLHHQVSSGLVSDFLASCGPEKRAQLIFTTHDLLLMDQRLMRKDEMWAVEKARDGAARLYPFSAFADIRSDRDILKSYLDGRLGGIPRPSRPVVCS